MKEKRKESRTMTSFPVACNTSKRRGSFYTVCKDLSSQGAKIITEEFVSCGNLFTLNIDLIEKIIGLKAQVCWCNKQHYSDRYNIGLKFVKIKNSDKTYLSNFLTATNTGN